MKSNHIPEKRITKVINSLSLFEGPKVSMETRRDLPVSWIKKELETLVSYSFIESNGKLEYYDYEKKVWSHLMVQDWKNQESIVIIMTPPNQRIVDALSQVFGYKPKIKFDRLSAIILEWKRPLWFKIKKILTEKAKNR